MEASPQALAPEDIRQEALRLGFVACGFSRADALVEDKRRVTDWLARGHHAGMGYMARNLEKRCDPRLLAEGTRTVLSLLHPYHTTRKQDDPLAPVLSSYAYGTDYHFVLKDKMRALFDFIRERRPEADGRIFVDSAPVLDRAWARTAGLGWIGRNSMLISRHHGSFVFIGSILLNLDLDVRPDGRVLPEHDLCGSCTLCVDACPTRAILPDRTLDAGRCISYQTIENKGPIPDEAPPQTGQPDLRLRHLPGCVSLEPESPEHAEPLFHPRAGLLELRSEGWHSMDRETYLRLFRNSPVKRAGLPKLLDTLRILRSGSR
ncbi:MAG: tRNA epoxyqueuosine(34) reductase QueG [Bacteroidales bacterium]